jgi:glycosyltransferase involved in cell wall biosynthesis
MKINYIFRSKLLQRYSIENVFRTIISEISKSDEVTSTYVPYSGAKPITVLKNMLYILKYRDYFNHITGDVHYLALILKKEKTILTINDLVSLKNRSGLRRFLLKLIWFDLPVRNCSIVTVISNQTKNELIDNIPHSKNKIRVVYCPLTSEFKYVEKTFNSDCPVILQIGTGSNKNLERVIEAIVRINCTLDIVGNLSSVQHELLTKNKISFTNSYNLSNEQVIEKYINSDIVIFVSTYEGFGLPIIEAQATGRPVITSNLPPMNEVAGDSACLVDPYDVNSISNAVQKLCIDMDYRNNLISKGIENIKRFSIEKISSDYIEIYKELGNE